jgi:LuxR family maltose regulon positive regulatory protein
MARRMGEDPDKERGTGKVTIPARDRPHIGAGPERKLHPPPVRKGWVVRSDLIRVLDQTPAKLLLIAAPAGYGKTALLVQWCSLSSDGRSFARVSLDRDDNEPVVLWRRIIQALQLACPAFGDDDVLLESVRGQYPDVTATLLPGLVNELAHLPAPVAIVLDNYDLIQEPVFHEQLEFLLDHLPSQAQIVLSSRADPPLPLARLRAGGDLTEIRMRDLRFTPDEANALIHATSAVELGEHDLRVLLERTEGWPGGLYLAALSLRGRPDPGIFVRQFTGGHRSIGDFLAKEVINRQPGSIREFLVHTAVLSRLTAQLCDAVTGKAHAREILGVLEHENVFLVPLDDRREWYRYHHLFAQALLSQLSETEPDLVPVLHQRASAWHRQWGSADMAVSHAMAAGDVDAAVTLIAEHWWTFVDTGRIMTVQAWLNALGDGQIAASPLAAHCATWVAALSGQREYVRRWLPVVEAGEHHGPLPDGMPSLQFSAALLKGAFGFWGLGQMRQSAARATELEDDVTSPWFGAARTAFGGMFYFSGELTDSKRQLEQALLSEPASSVVRLVASAILCLVAVEEGRLSQAQALAEAARDLLTGPAHGLTTAPQGSFADLASGAVYAAQGRLEEARNMLEKALQSRRRWPGINPWATVENLLRLAPVLQDLGNKPRAAALLAEAREVLASFPDGARVQLDRLERLERRLERPGPTGAAAKRLTPREEVVLRLLRGTLSLREIAQELYVSTNTVKSHTRAIYRKLGASDRQDAIVRSRELGIL